MCPESRGIAYCPFSSITSTGESANLSFTHGAIYRTAIPAAPIKIKAAWPQLSAISFCLSSGNGEISFPAYFSTVYPLHSLPVLPIILHNFRLSSIPVRVKLKIIILLSITVLFSQSRSPFISLILESIVLQLHSRTPGSLSIV